MSVSDRVRPRKALGQHWLSDRKTLRRIAEAAMEAAGGDTVVEIGAGTGLLTDILAQSAQTLIAVEVDVRLLEALKQRFGDRENVAVLQADVLEEPVEALLERGGGRAPYVVVGNLPYFIGTAIVRRFLQAIVRPRTIVVTLQAEVAESMTATAGRMTFLGVQTQTLATAQTLFHIPSKAFTPPPKVRSAVVRLDILDTPEAEVDDREAFLELVAAGFAAPRKRLRNSLAIGLRVGVDEAAAILLEAELDPTQRPANLTPEDWRTLYFAYRSQGRP